MTVLDLIPYQPITNKADIDEVIIQINRRNFDGIAFREGKITFPITDCLFKKVVIENGEDISFNDISILFINCYIGDLQVEKITSSNISILMFHSLVAGKIQNDKLLKVQLDHCLLLSGLFLIDLPKVLISLDEEKLEPRAWLAMGGKVHDFEEIYLMKQAYHIINVGTITAQSNDKNISSPNLIDLNLSLSYDNDAGESIVNISGLRLKALTISGKPKGKISVERMGIDALYIHNFTPTAEVGFYDIGPRGDRSETIIEIRESKLDTVWFDNVSFDKYGKVSFYRTRVAKTVFSSCNFPESYSAYDNFDALKNVHYPNERQENYDKDKYEIFLQLRKAMEASGNYYESQKLQSIAHDALKRIKGISVGDRIILWINGWSNNHGMSISKPFLQLMIISIVVYILYLSSLGRIFSSGEVDTALIGYYFSFIDLTHRTDFLVDKNELTGLSLFLDFANKVITGFFIYQFIAAFRKYGKG